MIASIRRTSLNLDFELVDQAKRLLGTSGTTDTVHRALADVVRRERIRRMLETMDGIFREPPPDGYGDWNDWMEDQSSQ
jgi:hypothetical protein